MRVLITRAAEVGQVVIPGTYAWIVTVAPAASARSHAPSLAPSLASSILALASLLIGAIVVKRHPRLGYSLGIWGFLIASLITWLLNPFFLQVDRLDPWRAGAGTIGWLLYALGWGTPWRIGNHPEDNPRAKVHPKLDPRSPPRHRTIFAVAIGTLGALTCLLLAWRNNEPERAILLHGAAVACAVGIINASAAIGLAQGQPRTFLPPKQRITTVFPWLMAVIALTIIGIAWAFGN